LKQYIVGGNSLPSKQRMSKKQYGKIKERLELGEIMINLAGGFMKAPKRWTTEYQRLAEQALMYEIENNLLPL